jgi:hypothetical protein
VLGSEQFGSRTAVREHGADDGSGGRADDKVGVAEAHALVLEAGGQSDLPCDADGAAAAEYECARHDDPFGTRRVTHAG